MKFEIGKFYKTRDGRKAQIFMLDNGAGYMLGAVNKDGVWRYNTWDRNGLWACSEHLLDLISEWEEPKKPKLMAHAIRKQCGMYSLSTNMYDSEKAARDILLGTFHSWPAVPNADGMYEVKE